MGLIKNQKRPLLPVFGIGWGVLLWKNEYAINNRRERPKMGAIRKNTRYCFYAHPILYTYALLLPYL